MEAVESTVDVRQQRIALIESISNLRKELGAPQIEAEEFDAMYDAELWILHAYEVQLLTYKEMKAML
jgi:hypothetical protein